MSTTIGDAGEISRPLCSKCNHNVVNKKHKIVDGERVFVGFTDKCTRCRRGYSRHSSKAWSLHKKDYCENPECTATIEIPDQLTVDHKDGNKKNNDPSNLITLCANCHALKTYRNRDFVNVPLRQMV